MQVVVSEYQGPTGLRGLFNGTGVARFHTGNTYTGQFEHGRMNGQGKYTWVDGLEFTGGFVRNHITGSGVSRIALSRHRQLLPDKHLPQFILVSFCRHILGLVGPHTEEMWWTAGVLVKAPCGLLAVTLSTAVNGWTACGMGRES